MAAKTTAAAPSTAKKDATTKSAQGNVRDAKPEQMNMKALCEEIANRLPAVSQFTVTKVAEVLFDVMSDAYAEGKIVNIKDFGKLSMQHRPARTARNPATGEPIQVPAKVVPKFSFARRLRDMANS